MRSMQYADALIYLMSPIQQELSRAKRRVSRIRTTLVMLQNSQIACWAQAGHHVIPGTEHVHAQRAGGCALVLRE